ncbi:Holliday junction branch migration protein RuvA [Clostridium sp. MCC353]|uniref:Holliday junction branch migration protein RuvA n=1 Tax=Clostridium sp. MCC353 TaxID=2592646 RepID=UPI001C023418|nr:Holliday junction branch migration protein RuvA [Clostridium sp. MCC353]
MISYIKGLLVETFEDTIVVEAGNIGYNIHVPLSLLERLPKIGHEVKVFTYFQVREDAMSLYGFLNRQDLDMFKQLIGVNGIGPKGALGVLSTLTPDSLRMAIISGDAKAISKAPGIGIKTAQRVILDLKDRVHIEDMLPQEAEAETLSGGNLVGQTGKEAMEALVALGYSGSEAAKAVRQVEIKDDMSVEDVLKASLKHLAFL